MAGPNLTYHNPIICVQNRANTAPLTGAWQEAATQSFKFGTPVQMNTAGYVKAWDGTTIAAGILGIAESFGQNLASPGLGAPSETAAFGQITGPIAIQTYGFVPNMPNAVNTALGTPVADGRTLYIEANLDNVFEAQCDNSAGVNAASWTPTQTTFAPGTNQFGLTVDANGFWYVDFNKTGGSAVLEIVGYNPLDGFIANARLRFKFLVASVQYLG